MDAEQVETIDIDSADGIKKLLETNNNSSSSREATSPETCHNVGDIDMNVEESSLPTRKKSVTGYQLFMKDSSRTSDMTIHDKNISISDMSKVASLAWRQLDSAKREEWNKKAQTLRESGNNLNQFPTCKKVFEKSKTFRFHAKNCKEVDCEHCGNNFKSMLLYKKHAKSHTPEAAQICMECDKIFCSKQALLRHAVIHSGSKEKHLCLACKQTFAGKLSKA